MSLTRTRFFSEVVIPAAYNPDMDAARAAFDPFNATKALVSDHTIKASDMGKFVAGQLQGAGTRPDFAPVLSEGEELDPFLEQFGVSALHKLAGSLPVYLSGCTVEIDEIMNWGDLSTTERLRLPHFDGFLPAVRVRFNPTDI